ncbi:MAG TPA: regulatory signaling modulator protein AmpE [Woeseiaceae bacterium]|nr:regulatory signaling modulator protein AmpE [Woeseiaceae bacterium]
MNLIALLAALVIERLATQWFHWRRMPWLDRCIDAGFLRMQGFAHWPPLVPVLLLGLALVLPVAVVTFALGDALLGFPYLILAIVVLFFSLGPNDIGEDVDEYCKAIERDDEDAIRVAAGALVEGDLPYEPLDRMRTVESAVFVQANNRLFAVIFWFVVLGPLGPLGAWAYRVTDLMRRRAVITALPHPAAPAPVAGDAETLAIAAVHGAAIELHAWLAWLPARLTAIGYGVAGHFDGALQAWRGMPAAAGEAVAARNELLLARVGLGAMAFDEDETEPPAERGVRGASAANRLVFRQLLIWVVVIAALTLYGWTL